MAMLNPSAAFDTLAAQHAVLRERIERCDALADEVDIGMTEPGRLLEEVAQLRGEFDEHNRFEEQLLRPLLLDVEWLGAVRVSRMVEDHVQEHRAMQLGLGATPTAELRRVLANLRDHLSSEERYLLSRSVLRADLDR
jgi:iron-sulfur cluster repair protein YtfE (RIC family)